MEVLKRDLAKHSSDFKAKILSSFFKTRKGDYGYGDFFIGVPVPTQRKIAKGFLDISLKKIRGLLLSKIHEHRSIGLIILVEKYKKGDVKEKKKLFDFYISNISRVNNWDLVDFSALNLIGDYLFDKDKRIIYNFAKSENLWKRRVAIVSTLGFVRKGSFEDSLKISKILLEDKCDLIQKAVGWILREVGKRNFEVEDRFLKENYLKMSRTTLRYSIEKFPEELRQEYLNGRV